MNRIDEKEQKSICLEILTYIDMICKKHKINYSLAGGTLLGAVRHKGFIPWDDDIDIVLVREEYEKLIKILKKETAFLLIEPNDIIDYKYSFSKLIKKNTILCKKGLFKSDNKKFGIFIDIFPVDGLPEGEAELIHRNNIYELSDNVSKSTFYYAESENYFKTFIKLFAFYPMHRKLNKEGNALYWKKLVDAEMKKYSVFKSKYCGFLLSPYANKEKFPSNIFQEYINIEFEGHNFQCIKNYKVYLNQLYGDYMQLPPLEKRTSQHEYIAYWED